MKVPFFRPQIGREEIDSVVDTLESGWLTSGPKVDAFEQSFADKVGARHAVALNSATAALHLAVEALDLAPGDGVLVPTHTFAATAEIVLYRGGIPVLVDCEPETGNLCFDDAERKIEAWSAGTIPIDGSIDPGGLVGILPVHVGGHLIDKSQLQSFTAKHGLWSVEDAAHAFPAAWLENEGEIRLCGSGVSEAACFSFYANKTITTGEGGMLITDDRALAERAKLMSLHGLSHDAWGRYSGNGKWDYRIVAPGYKYNLTDLAAAIGLEQLKRADAMRAQRERIARLYLERLSEVEELDLPPFPNDRLHSWHLFSIRLRLERLAVSRDQWVEELGRRGIGFSVHWRPLHLHPFYSERLGWQPRHCPLASDLFPRLVSLPIFPSMTDAEIDHVIATVKALCREHRVSAPISITAVVDCVS